MEKIPNEILLKIFSYLEVQDLGRCASVNKKFHEIAYEKMLWQKLPVNLAGKQVPVEFLQHIMKHGIAYINLDSAQIHTIGDLVHFGEQNSVKYLIIDFHLESTWIQIDVKNIYSVDKVTRKPESRGNK